MNAFVPENPRVVLAVDTNGKLVRAFNNIDPQLSVEVVPLRSIEEAAAGVPYDSANPRVQTQVLAAKKK